MLLLMFEDDGDDGNDGDGYDPFKQRHLMQLREGCFKKPCFVSIPENSTYHKSHMII